MGKKARKSLSIKLDKPYSTRLQPYEDDPLSEVADWLNSMPIRDANRKVEEVLLMALLPYARSDSLKYSHEQLIATCLRSSDALMKHDYLMRQALNVPVVESSSAIAATSVPANGKSTQLSDLAAKPKKSSSGHLSGKSSAVDADPFA